MNLETINIRYEELNEELNAIKQLKITAGKKLASSLKAVRMAVQGIRTLVINEGFEDQGEEIAFFKYEKPRFISEQLLALEIFNIEINRPKNGETDLKVFYTKELKFIKRFFEQHRFFYQYYQLDAVDMDHLFFVRGAQPADVFLPDVQNFDPIFATAGDYLFAKFMTFERLQDHLLNLLNGNKDGQQSPKTHGKGKVTKWTGSKSDLVELAYGIYRSGKVNDGNAEIAEIVNWLEHSFSTDLGRYYQTFSEIKARKTGSKTSFLDQLKEGLTKYITDGEAFKPQRRW